ncbi:ankyrin repeat-containing domain protein [Ochromonadaceae sp. CCMP2298]|nr:ankyrin repeat-containing domain protein [Ochromonadaceae sp. CCMP2298]
MILLSSLERIVRNDSRYNKIPRDPSKDQSLVKQSQDRRLDHKFARLYSQKREAVLAERLYSLATSRAQKYAIAGDEFKLRQELVIGHPVDERDSRSGRTLLHESSAGGNLHLVRMLVYDFSAHVNLHTSLGKATALHIAVDGNYRQIASLLISNGADLNARDLFGRTPLHMVKSVGLLRLLLKYPVDVAAKSVKGLTPMGYYLSVTPVDQRVDEIWHTLGPMEDKKAMENTRKEVRTARLLVETQTDRWALINDTESTLLDPDEQQKPW